MSSARVRLASVLTLTSVILASCGGGGDPAGTRETAPGAGRPAAREPSPHEKPPVREHPGPEGNRPTEQPAAEPPAKPTAKTAPPSLRERFHSLVDAGRKARRAAIEPEVAKLKEDLAAAEKEYNRLKRTATTVGKLNKARAAVEELGPRLKERSAELDQVPAWEPRLLPENFREGDVARLGTESGSPVVRVLQVVDDRNMLVEFGDDLIWVETPTGGYVDGKRYTLSGIGEGLGARRYTTAIGTTRTVVWIRVDQDD